MAANRASEFGVEISIHQAILEGDSAIIVTALAEADFGAATYSLFLKEANNFFPSYSKLSHSYTKRDGNKVAQSLAKSAINFPNCTIWMEDVPSQSLYFVQANLANLLE
ncbi:hypothetical protein SO802_030578 [Lithocarpus litseifolius]|uniref:RNase H type-1 domain-containing protein n=1 Tax=Lithocarpus litseifolius TaxID=425828 RepID=A0AAW2BKE3_9ROSI